MRWRRCQRRGAVIVVIAAVLLLLPAAAFAAEPVLEYVVPGGHLPVSFTTEGGPISAEMAGFGTLVHCAASRGEGEITGPRSSASQYSLTGCVTEGGTDAGAKCKSEGASEEEIRIGLLEADLVYISQARGEVGELLNPDGGIYIVFECGGESAEGRGPFLSSLAPINIEASVFTATLSVSGSLQSPTNTKTRSLKSAWRSPKAGAAATNGSQRGCCRRSRSTRRCRSRSGPSPPAKSKPGNTRCRRHWKQNFAASRKPSRPR